MSLRERALAALKKPAAYGLDVDVSEYIVDQPRVESSPEALPRGIDASIESRVGVRPSKSHYVQLDQVALYGFMRAAVERYGVKVMPLRVALEKTDLARELAWRLVKPDADKYTALAYLQGGELGYFIYVPKGVRVPTPLYTCLVLKTERRAQLVHNVIYVDDGAEAHVVSGCAVPHGLKGGLHVGISEYYVGRGARLTFSMIHSWAEGLHVRPRTAVRVEEGGEYVSYYMIYSPVASIQTNPVVELGEGAKLYSVSVVAGRSTAHLDVGTVALLNGRQSRAELVSRVVAFDESTIYARGDIHGNAPETAGHIECLGLMASPKGTISSIPVVTSRDPTSKLSHEAAIGVIAQEEIEYLMSKGFSEDEARAIIIRGFMSVDAPGLPLSVKKEIERLTALIASGGAL
ncbi:MAG: SufD family Fe-S cluster assembly protein [Acidilobaceae archaeon]